jgi:hypothetical protein
MTLLPCFDLVGCWKRVAVRVVGYALSAGRAKSASEPIADVGGDPYRIVQAKRHLREQLRAGRAPRLREVDLFFKTSELAV